MTNLRTDLADYYERRAPHYDAIYTIPARQPDLRRLQGLIPTLLADRDVLEVAAGTGYWTQVISTTARTVHATDYNPTPLAIAATRDYPRQNVRFDRADGFALDHLPDTFTGAFVGFWWSHVLLDDIERFLRGLCSRLRPGSTVVVVDNRYVEGSSHPITRTDTAGNTYQRRKLHDGTTHEVLKNFPTPPELLNAARRHGTASEILELDHYWVLTLTVPPTA